MSLQIPFEISRAVNVCSHHPFWVIIAFHCSPEGHLSNNHQRSHHVVFMLYSCLQKSADCKSKITTVYYLALYHCALTPWTVHVLCKCVLVPEVNWLFVLPWVPTETESRVSCVHISWKVRFVYRCMSQCSCNIVRVVLLVAIEVEQPLSPSWPRSFCCSYPQSDK